LPASPSLEKEGTFTSTERRIQRLYQVFEPMEGSRPDWQIVQAIANRLGAEWNYKHPSEIYQEIASLTPLFAGVSYRAASLKCSVARFGSSDKVLEIVVEAIKTPELIRGIRNFLVLVKLLGTVEPELVEGLARSLAEALTLAKTYESKPPGFWRTELHQFRSRDLRRGLVFISSLLEAFGQELAPEKRRA